MKKFLVLMLVLGIASAANATLSLSFDGQPNPGEVTITISTVFIVDVHQDAANEYPHFWVGYTGPATPTGDPLGQMVAPAPADYVLSDGGYGPGWVYAYKSGTAFGDPGEWWVLEMHCSGEGDFVVDLYDPTGGTVIDTLTVHQIVPEPMTIALLGLGGLLLRRRK